MKNDIQNKQNPKEKIMPATKSAKEEVEEPTSERERMTVYITKHTAKKFKIFAIEEDTDYSKLAELAFTELLEKHQKLKS